MSMDMHIQYIRVPYWRVMRPRWTWMVLGFLVGLTVGVII